MAFQNTNNPHMHFSLGNPKGISNIWLSLNQLVFLQFQIDAFWLRAPNFPVTFGITEVMKAGSLRWQQILPGCVWVLDLMWCSEQCWRDFPGLRQACVSSMDQKGRGSAVSVYVSMVFNIFTSFNSIFFVTYCPSMCNILFYWLA